jgi:hypothetical protein
MNIDGGKIDETVLARTIFRQRLMRHLSGARQSIAAP